jgi:hypothetical protein
MEQSKTAEEIVTLLRSDYASDQHVMDDMSDAANMIESIQFRNGCLESSVDSLDKTVAVLKAQFAASQQRERAAVEAIKDASHNCGFHFTPCTVRRCGLSEWCEYQGPQQAGEGERVG